MTNAANERELRGSSIEPLLQLTHTRTLDELRAAQLVVISHAEDERDAYELLGALGLLRRF